MVVVPKDFEMILYTVLYLIVMMVNIINSPGGKWSQRNALTNSKCFLLHSTVKWASLK